MTNHPQARTRRFIGMGVALAILTSVAYLLSPGLPVLWGPSADAATLQAGAVLFEHEWQPNDPLAHGDGLGPVFNDRSCVACHFQGGIGGGGSVEHNVTAFEVHPTTRDPELVTGILHAASVEPCQLETASLLQQRFPVIPGRTLAVTVGGCTSQVVIRDLNPIHSASVNSTALFGAGWIDRVSPKAITANRWGNAASAMVREFQLDWNTIPPGRPRILPDGRVGKFGWKGQAATLEEFVAAACANEIGLGNPLMSQATSMGSTAEKVPPDLDRKQFNALVAFVDTLPRPEEIVSDEPYHRAAAVRGKEVFSGIGCAVCHTPDLGGVAGIYSDFLLHTVEGNDNPSAPGGGYGDNNPDELPLPTDFPKASEWKTPPLWGVADSAPYFHDGGSVTLKDAILRHRGDAKTVTEAFRRLSTDDQGALVVFLKTLKAPPAARPYTKTEQVAMRGR